MMKGVFRKRFLDEVIKKSWWVFLLVFVCMLFYSHFADKRQKELEKQRIKVSELENRLNAFQLKKDELVLQLNSQSDPQWIEMVLMKQLGVVPQGYIKVHFKKE